MDIGIDSARFSEAEHAITVWDSKRLNSVRRTPIFVYLSQCIDEMGKRSKAAQGLNAVLTSVQRLHDNPTHRLYLFCTGKQCLGILKVGTKKLFIRHKSGQLNEIDPLCVLDFYVHETQQRSGLGKQLFESMCRAEGANPAKLGYDRPSVKFIAFLRKHYNLSDYVPQSNNFVVFAQYFVQGSASVGGGGQDGASGAPQTSSANREGSPNGGGSIGSGKTTSNSLMYPTQQVGQRADAQQFSDMDPRVLKKQHSLPGISASSAQHGSAFAWGDRGATSMSSREVLPGIGQYQNQQSGTQRGDASGADGSRLSQTAVFPQTRHPLATQPQSQALQMNRPTFNSAPTIGLSSSCYPGRSAGAPSPTPATASDLARVSRPGAPSSSLRDRSPTRSGVDYDIISGTGGNAGGAGDASMQQTLSSSTAKVQPAVAVVDDRPAGRRSQRQW